MSNDDYKEDQRKVLDDLRKALDAVYDEHITGETLTSHWHRDMNRLLVDVFRKHGLWDGGPVTGTPNMLKDRDLILRWRRLQTEREYL